MSTTERSAPEPAPSTAEAPGSADGRPVDPGASPVPDTATDAATPAAPVDETWLDGERLALRPEVEKIQGADDQQLLFSTDEGRYTRLSRSGAQLVKLLDGRRTGRQIQAAVEKMGPAGERLSPSIPPFLAELRQANVLNVAPAEERGAQKLARRAGGPLMKRLPLTRSTHAVVAPAARLAERTPKAIRAGLLPLLLSFAVTLVAFALFSGPSAAGAFVPVAIVVLLAQITTHELAHAFACERRGVPVREAGIGLMLGVIPVAYVDRTDAYRVRSRKGRAAIALAGPANDLLWTGACAAVVLTTSGIVAETATLVLFFQLALLAANLNLILPTDGYHAIEAMAGEMNFRGRATSYVVHRVLRQPLPSTLQAVSRRRRAAYVSFVVAAVLYGVLFVGLTAVAILAAM
ncbi:M50 family metallopeptidase [Patulibacter minatonensis]|uniref:M50 family metallopeptidase n=1 Tax=Patulibacter minatonensis TaxID=298163 RepID=UPI0006877354|nr:site-2 protease family protein [Patulibacter minatonensis]